MYKSIKEISKISPRVLTALDRAKKHGKTASLSGLIFLFIGYVDHRMDAVEAQIVKTDTSAKEYVDLKYDTVKQSLDEIKETLKTIDDRVYQLTKEK